MTYTSAAPFHGDRLLVVDDLPDNSYLIQAILEEEGYPVVIKDNGQAALDYIAATPPALVLLDVMMPSMDGYEVTRQIRSNPQLPFIPIVLITAHDRSSVVKGLDLGADDFVRKPVEVEELLARVRSLLRLKHSIDERERITKMREDFVSRLTHDLRTPMVAADRMLGLLLDNALGELSLEMQQALQTMARSNKNLLAMVNNLLQVYRFEAGKQRLNFAKVSLANLIKDVVQELQPLAQEKGLSLALNLDSNVPALEGDRLELQRVVTNLLGNAIKFTDQGEITLHLHLEPTALPTQPLSAQQIILKVEDTGVGIQLEEQALLFERFRSGRDQRAGSGLGLHLSRYILEAHGGTIKVTSEPGHGSCFTVHLPLQQNPQQELVNRPHFIGC